MGKNAGLFFIFFGQRHRTEKQIRHARPGIFFIRGRGGVRGRGRDKPTPDRIVLVLVRTRPRYLALNSYVVRCYKMLECYREVVAFFTA